MTINQNFEKVIEALKSGKVIAIKTDTVYGLVCNANDIDACNKIYKIKKRERKKPLSIFVKDIESVQNYVSKEELSEYLVHTMHQYWPGPLTIILKKKYNILNHITDGQDSIGIRIPNDDFLLNILNNVDFPLAQTSCNLSGEKEYKNAREIEKKLGNEVDLIVDGGEVKDSVASTIIKFDGKKVKVIREGTIKINE